jgi:anion transporter
MTTLVMTARDVRAHLLQRTLLGAIIGPLAGLMIWGLPLGLEPRAQTTLAIVAFMVVYWLTEPIEHGVTALIGCYLFWALQIVPFSVAFSGFVNTSPWFVFGALLMGEAVSRTGLAKRIGYAVLYHVGTSYTRLLLGSITLVYLLSFLIPTPNAELTVLISVLIGTVTVLGLAPSSPMVKGLFLSVTYSCTLFAKMNLAAAANLLARGLIEEQTGLQVWWGQWFLAFFPAALLTIAACWLTTRWLYPAATPELAGGQQSLQDAVKTLGPWSRDEQKVLVWLLLAITLWATDFLHHTNPAVIALGIGLLLALPQVGVLDAKAIKSVNFLLIIFISGALSMGNVLTQTKVLNILTERLMQGLTPMLSDGLRAAITLYWGGFVYHFLLAEDKVMVTTVLPVLLKFAQINGYNPVAVGMIWAFAAGGKLFVYQSSVLIYGYSYGYFTGRDLLKVAGILTLIEGIILMVLVPLYWPLIGLPWRNASPATPLTRGADMHSAVDQRSPWATGARSGMSWGECEPQRSRLDSRVVGRQTTVDETVCAEKLSGLLGQPSGNVGLTSASWVAAASDE